MTQNHENHDERRTSGGCGIFPDRRSLLHDLGDGAGVGFVLSFSATCAVLKPYRRFQISYIL